ncbi:SDR family NAD(P)-dependent oxidoreductase [Massilia cavernae]|nr:SDR family oxidoreductase [Massilia cavernae]
MRTLKDKVVFITGAGSGFGRCLALQVAKLHGIPVLADIDADGLAETVRQLQLVDARYGSHVLDIRSRQAWEAVAAATEKEFGGIDVLINNAGVLSRTESFLELSEEHCRFLMEVNFWGMFYGTRTMIPYLAKRPEGHLVNTASSLALIGSPMHSVYCASKAAVANFTAVVREELYGTRIGVTTVFPGASRTNLGRNVPADSAEIHEANVKNFDKFASTLPDAVAAKIVAAILNYRTKVVTGMDGLAMSFFNRAAPRTGHWLLGAAYRKIGDPKLYARLAELRLGSVRVTP